MLAVLLDSGMLVLILAEAASVMYVSQFRWYEFSCKCTMCLRCSHLPVLPSSPVLFEHDLVRG